MAVHATSVGRLGVLFELRHAETRPGEFVSVVGSRAELGAWDSYTSGLQLRTGASCYPCWAMLAPVWLTQMMQCSRERQYSEGSEESTLGLSADDSVTGRNDDEDQEPEVVSFFDCEASEGGSPDSGHPQFIHIEYKYVKDRRQLRDCGPSIQWEDSIANRMVMAPCYFTIRVAAVVTEYF